MPIGPNSPDVGTRNLAEGIARTTPSNQQLEIPKNKRPTLKELAGRLLHKKWGPPIAAGVLAVTGGVTTGEGLHAISHTQPVPTVAPEKHKMPSLEIQQLPSDVTGVSSATWEIDTSKVRVHETPYNNDDNVDNSIYDHVGNSFSQGSTTFKIENPYVAVDPSNPDNHAVGQGLWLGFPTEKGWRWVAAANIDNNAVRKIGEDGRPEAFDPANEMYNNVIPVAQARSNHIPIGQVTFVNSNTSPSK